MSSKRVGTQPDPWPATLRAQLNSFSCQEQTATAAADETQQQQPHPLTTLVRTLAESVMPEQRTQLLARIGEVLSNNTNNSSNKQATTTTGATTAATPAITTSNETRISLLRTVFLPLLFDSRVRYLHKSVMNLIRGKLHLDEATIVTPAVRDFATHFLLAQKEQQHGDTAAASAAKPATTTGTLQFANDLDAVSIMVMPAFPSAFEQLFGLVVEALVEINDRLVVPTVLASIKNTSNSSNNREVMTDTQLAELRFACRVVTTLFHKYARNLRELLLTQQQQQQQRGNKNDDHQAVLKNSFSLAASSAAMLSCTGGFPKDLLNSSGLLVATALECIASSAASATSSSTVSSSATAMLNAVADCAESVSGSNSNSSKDTDGASTATTGTTTTSSILDHRVQHLQELLMLEQKTATTTIGQLQHHICGLLSGMCVMGTFALLRGLLSHYSGMKEQQQAAPVFGGRITDRDNNDSDGNSSNSSSSHSTSFIKRCYDYAARWADRVDEPEARFLAIQTLDSVTRCYQEVVFVKPSTDNDSSSSSSKNSTTTVAPPAASVLQAAAVILDGISTKLLALWDDPTISVSGPLFETFDRIIQCKAQIQEMRQVQGQASSSASTSSSSSSFLITTMADLLRPGQQQHQHERRGVWQVVSSLVPRMSLTQVVAALNLATNRNSTSNSDSSTDDLTIIATFLVPLLCRCSTSNKCNSLCGDVVVALVEKMLLAQQQQKQQPQQQEGEHQVVKNVIFTPMVQQCLLQQQQQQQQHDEGSSSSSNNTVKAFINSVVTHLIAPCFRSVKIGPSRAVQLAVSAILELDEAAQTATTTAAAPRHIFEWLIVFTAWRAKGSDVDFLSAINQQQQQQPQHQIATRANQLIEQGLFSPESDIRCAAAEVVVMPSKSVTALVAEERLTAFIDFCNRNWNTGETTFRNSMVTLIKKVLGRLVDTAKNAKWRDEILTPAAGGAAAVASSNEQEQLKQKQLDQLKAWKDYVVMILASLHRLTVRITATMDTEGFCSDRAMTNLIVMTELQDCVMHFVGATPSTNNTTADQAITAVTTAPAKPLNQQRRKAGSVLEEIRQVTSLLAERHEVAAATVQNTWDEFINSIVSRCQQQEQQEQHDLLVARVFSLLSNGWTALRNAALNFLVRSFALKSSSIMEKPLLAFLLPGRAETVSSLLARECSNNSNGNNSKSLLDKACEAVTSASTLRSSSHGVAVLQLIAELASAGASVPEIKLTVSSSFSFTNGSLLAFAQFICDQAQATFTATEASSTDLAAAPLHGFLGCIAALVPLALQKQQQSDTNNNNSNLNHHQQLFDRSLSLTIRALNIAATFVGSHSNDVATAAENGGSTSNNKIDCRGHIICDENQDESSTRRSRRIVNNAWLAVCLGTHAIERLVSCSHLYKNSGSNSSTNSRSNSVRLSSTSANTIAQTLIRLLLNSKHNGVISKSRGCLRHLAFGLFRAQGDDANQQQLRSVPGAVLGQLLESESGVKCTSSQRMLRRSQGLPHAIAPILEAEDHSVPPVLLPRTLNFLVETAHAATTTSFDAASAKAMEIIAAKEAVVVHGVNALNVLKFIFEDSQLGALAQPWVERAFLVALRGFESADWFLRNSALMLFTAVAKRAMGDQAALVSRTVGSIRVSNCTTTLADLAARLPQALPAMVNSLAPVSSSGASAAVDDESVHRPSVFPILFVLSMLKPMSESNNNRAGTAAATNAAAAYSTVLIQAVGSCLLSGSLPARVSASSALLAVSPQTNNGEHLVFAMRAAERQQQQQQQQQNHPMTRISWNAVHGIATLVMHTCDAVEQQQQQQQNQNYSQQFIEQLFTTVNSIYRQCLSHSASCPSGVWNAVLKMTASVRRVFPGGSDEMSQCLEFVCGQILSSSSSAGAAAEFHRTSADELYESVCRALPTSMFAEKATQILTMMTRQQGNNNSDNNISNSISTIGTPAWRFAKAAVQYFVSFCEQERSSNVYGVAANLLQALLSPPRPLQLWERIHAADCMVSCLECLSGQNQQQQLNNQQQLQQIRNSVANLLAAESPLETRLPSRVVCAMYLFWARNSDNLNNNAAATTIASVRLRELALPSSPMDFRATCARCVTVLLRQQQQPQQNSTVMSRVYSLAVLLCFDDDPAIRRLAAGAASHLPKTSGSNNNTWRDESCQLSSVHALIAAWRNNNNSNRAEYTAMAEDIIKCVRTGGDDAEKGNDQVEDDDENNGDENEDEDEEEDLFTKDSDNAFAEVGVMREMLFL